MFDPGASDDPGSAHYVFPPIPTGGAVSCPSLARRVIALAEIGAEGVVHREPDVVRCRDHHVRDDTGLQAPHPVSEHHLRDPTKGLEALGQEPQRGLGTLVVGEPDEADPGERQHRTEHVQPTEHAPVDDQVLWGSPRKPDT